jgi:FlaA1/EpsC-like NDP-sugar epimerase
MNSAGRTALVAIASAIVLSVVLVVALTGSGRAAERSWLVLLALVAAAAVALVRSAWRAWMRRRAARRRTEAAIDGDAH